MSIRVYNTLTKPKEPLETTQPGKVGIYLCGPTVYKESHIGHMVGPVIFDTIKRYLKYSGYEVTWVVNITDVDDKLIAQTHERGVPMSQIAEEMTIDYLNNLRALGVDQISLYQFHAPDPGYPFEKSVEAFAELQREGKVKDVGLSNVSVKQMDAASKILTVASVQNRLNPYFREALENGVVYECEKRGIPFLAYSPVGGGRLAKKLPQFPVLQEIAGTHDASPHAVVLAWVRSK